MVNYYTRKLFWKSSPLPSSRGQRGLLVIWHRWYRRRAYRLQFIGRHSCPAKARWWLIATDVVHHAVILTLSTFVPSQGRRWVGRARRQAPFTVRTRRTADLPGDALLEVEVLHRGLVLVYVYDVCVCAIKRQHQLNNYLTVYSY